MRNYVMILWRNQEQKWLIAGKGAGSVKIVLVYLGEWSQLWCPFMWGYNCGVSIFI